MCYTSFNIEDKNMNSLKENIIQLSSAFGPSGFEDAVAEIVKTEMSDFQNLQEDSLRNVRCSLPANTGSRPVMMLDAHLDEVGLIVQAVHENGTMSFLELGRQAPSSLPSSRFLIRNRRGELIPAAVASKPPHFMNEAEKKLPPAIDSMILDCGSTSQKETEESYGIRMASPAACDHACTYDAIHGVFSGKAFDCRIGVAAEIELMKRLQNQNLQIDAAAAFSSQEEVGERGVHANVQAIHPDIAICFEGCPADDTFTSGAMTQTVMGRGPMLRHFDVCMITNPRYQRFALDTAEKYGIPCQESVRAGGGTDGGVIHLLDVPCIVIGIPVRYIHSGSCYAMLKDAEAAVDLAEKICTDLSADIIHSF